MNIVMLIALVVFIEALLHYFPWRLILSGKKLPRVAAYMLGVLGMMVPFTAWLIENGELIIVRTLWLVIISGGLSVMVAYGLDKVLDLIWRVREYDQREKAMQEYIDGQSK